MTMRRSLRWTLGATVAMSLLSLWWPGDPEAPRVVQAAVEAGARNLAVVEAVAAGRMGTVDEAHLTPLPERWELVRLEPAKRDFFADAPAVVVEAPPAAVEPAPPPAPAPEPPAVHYRFLGRMTGPGGEQLVYLSKNGQALPVKVGDQLEEGYVVAAIDDLAVQLQYPPLGTQAVISIPPAVPTTP